MQRDELIKKYKDGCRDFRGVDLRWENLRDCNLRGCELEEANLEGADLRGADLRGAFLRWANLWCLEINESTNLSKTILDPEATLPEISDEELIKEGLTSQGDLVIGYRTKWSQCTCKKTEYVAGQTYKAPYFSVSRLNTCHPGLYIAGLDFLERYYPNSEFIRVACLRKDLLHVGNKWRCRELQVLGNV